MYCTDLKITRHLTKLPPHYNDVRPSLAKKTMTSYHWEVVRVGAEMAEEPISARKCLLQWILCGYCQLCSCIHITINLF